jgi:hypothetical protein
MPIRLNLLAEAQAAEDARRRDPVKRAVWMSALIIVLILVWISSLQLKAILVNSEVSRLEGQVNSHTNEYRGILDSQNKSADIKYKLDALRSLSARRLLQGTLLNAFQQTTVEDVQLIHLGVDQLYTLAEGTRTHTNDNNVVIPGRPATATEKIVVNLEGVDSSSYPGDQVNRFKDALATNTYFKEMLARTNAVSLKNLSAPQVAPVTGKACVIFTLECRYPEKTR